MTEDYQIIQIEISEKVVRLKFNGNIYRRYPQSKRWSDRFYFRCTSKNGNRLLHRDIWKFHNGEIPEGFQIHHKDGNALNNNVENLEAISKEEHQKHHLPTTSQRQAIAYKQTRRFALKEANKEAVKWHSSDIGRKWHSEHGKKLMAKRKLQSKICANCEKKYLTVSISSKDKFCSNKCRAAFRRSLKIDNVVRNCKVCQKEFSMNKYKNQVTCSCSCSAKLRWEARKCKKNTSFQKNQN